jgi:stress response protein YsnF
VSAAAPVRATLPLDAQVEHVDGATVVRFRLRAEDVRVEKETFVSERVAVRKARVDESETVRETVRREELVVNTGGDVERTQRLDLIPGPDVVPKGTEPPPRPAPVPWAQRVD